MDVIPHPTKPRLWVVVVDDNEVISIPDLKKFAIGFNPKKVNLHEYGEGDARLEDALLWIQLGTSNQCIPASYRVGYLMGLSADKVKVSASRGFHYFTPIPSLASSSSTSLVH